MLDRVTVLPRSMSKTGLDKSDRKGGAGAHNWGALSDEQDLEFRAGIDNEGEGLGADEASKSTLRSISNVMSNVLNHWAVETELAGVVEQGQAPAHDGSLSQRRSSDLSEEEWKQAKEFRARAVKNGRHILDFFSK